MAFRLLFFTLLILSFDTNAQSLIINEVMSSNFSIINDFEGDNEDWIEIYNPGNEAIDLTGYFFSDNENDPYKWVFPEAEIAANEFLLIWASGKDLVVDNALHTNFKIDNNGETILISDLFGNLIDLKSIPALPGDVSYGSQPNGGNQYYFFDSPTPGYSNNGTTGVSEVLSTPELSATPGFYTSEFYLQLTHPDPLVEIYFTLDGSEPTTGSALYTEPILIYDRQDDPDGISSVPTTPLNAPVGYRWFPPMENVYKATNIRVRAFKENALPSPIKTATYFVDENIFERYPIPIISLSTPQSYLLGSSGIYTNYLQTGMGWEKKMHLEFFEPNGELQFNSDVGVRVHGGNSRRYALKSFRIYFRSQYGLDNIEYPFFHDQDPPVPLERFILRNSGSDWNRTYFRDAVQHHLTLGYADMEIMHYQPSVVFINGEYWGVMNIRERFDDEYIRNKFGYEQEEIDMLESSGSIVYGSNQHYSDLKSFLQVNDLNEPGVYEYVKTQMETKNFRDYHIFQIFSMNTDQPGKNVRFWRPKTPEGRWRWMLFDMDDAFSLNPHCAEDKNGFVYCVGLDSISDPVANPTSPIPAWAPNSPSNTFMLRAMLKGSEFRTDFINRFADLLNSAFLPQRITNIINSFYAETESCMMEHYHRWHRPEPEFRDEHVNLMLQFGQLRKAYVEEHLLHFFELENKHELTVDVSNELHGNVKVNSIVIDPDSIYINSATTYPWTGNYYSQVPLPLIALPKEGYQFVEWLETGNTNDTIVVELSGNTTFTAIFEPTTVSTGEEETEEEILSIYPNPAKNKVNVETKIPINDNYHLTITDPGGKMVMQKSISENRFLWNIQSLKAGYYTITLLDENQVKITSKPLIVL